MIAHIVEAEYPKRNMLTIILITASFFVAIMDFLAWKNSPNINKRLGHALVFLAAMNFICKLIRFCSICVLFV